MLCFLYGPGEPGRYPAQSSGNMSRSWRLSNPYESPSQTDGKSRSRLLSADNPKYLWLFGYLSQIVLFALFIAAMLADFSITELESRDVVFVIFNCLVAVFALTSTFAILIMTSRTIGMRVTLVIGSLLLFGATYFVFWIIVVGIAFSSI